MIPSAIYPQDLRRQGFVDNINRVGRITVGDYARLRGPVYEKGCLITYNEECERDGSDFEYGRSLRLSLLLILHSSLSQSCTCCDAPP